MSVVIASVMSAISTSSSCRAAGNPRRRERQFMAYTRPCRAQSEARRRKHAKRAPGQVAAAHAGAAAHVAATTAALTCQLARKILRTRGGHERERRGAGAGRGVQAALRGGVAGEAEAREGRTRGRHRSRR